MATKVVMEALSPTMEEGRLVRWLKPEGASVANGDTLAEVETDKAIMELVARGDGVLRRQLVAEGATAPIGTLLGVIAAPNEDIAALVGAPSPAPAVAAPAPAAVAPEAPVAVTTSESERVRSSPLARRLAAERGLDLHAIAGSGPNGRIVKRDLDATVAPATPAAPVAAVPVTAGADYTDIALTQIRRTIARRLAESIGPVPTFYLTAELDVERVSEMRKAMAELGDDYKVSVNDIVLKAVATALAQHPEVNAHWLGDRIRQFARVHLGVAVAIDEGLITPVVFDADKKRLRDIAREVRELATRAKARRLKTEEYTGSTFSVSNLGMFGIDQFTAIINPPEAGILAIGAVEAKPVVVGEAVVVRRRMRVTMSCDHRVIDGATGAKFLATLRRLIENPLLLVY
ncbi:MAG TPA: dihydrolipoamide acetyltransferase family protein [Gemmatimonadaceae bacterium]|nr:dihydrolipoamide acetyltransferase family protein [Gemmatimonadaceae bacterium]